MLRWPPKSVLLKCELCDFESNERHLLNTHTKVVHLGEKPHKCQQCPESFLKKRDLIRHLCNVHHVEKPFKCEYCENSFISSSLLKHHAMKHSGKFVKIENVSLSTWRFIESHFLMAGIDFRLFIGEKPYKCDVCDYATTRRGNLRTHQRIHTGEKPYQCDICDKRFSTKPKLTQHIFVHTGEKPFK